MKQKIPILASIPLILVALVLLGCAAGGTGAGAGEPTVTAIPLPTGLQVQATAVRPSAVARVSSPTESPVPTATASPTPSPTTVPPSPTATATATATPRPGVTATATATVGTQSQTRPVQSGPRPTATPEFSGKLVFQTTVGDVFYSINADGSGLQRLTDGVDPVWSPDGRKIAFTRWRNPRGLWVLDLDRAAPENEWRAFDWSSARWPSWSPDGQQLLFSLQKGGRLEDQEKCFFGFCFTLGAQPHWRLGIVQADGGGFREPPSSERSLAPSWSPDGSLIVYGDQQGLRVQNEDRTYSVLITDSGSDTSPAWSPDGSRVAFMRQLHDHWEIFVVDAAGQGLAQLTRSPVRPDGEPGSSAAPAWSPDGRHIAFLTDRTGGWELWVMRPDGSQQKPMFPSALEGLTLEYGSVSERAISWTGTVGDRAASGSTTTGAPATPTPGAPAEGMDYFAPVLVAPSSGATFVEGDEVILEWQPVGQLAANEYYVLSVSYRHEGDTWFDDVPWTKDTSWTLSEHLYLPALSDNGEFYWSVRIMRRTGMDAAGKPEGEAISPASEERLLLWRSAGPRERTEPTPDLPEP